MLTVAAFYRWMILRRTVRVILYVYRKEYNSIYGQRTGYTAQRRRSRNQLLNGLVAGIYHGIYILVRV